MNATLIKGVDTSPVNIENRQELGIKPGDTVRVHQKIQERGKTRIQIFEGLVLARKHGNEAGATFTVRKVVDGIGVEKIFPLYSPLIDKIEIVRRSKVRRAKLYYIREKVAREIKRQMRRMQMMERASVSEAEEAARAEEEAKAAEEAAAAEAEKQEETIDAPAEEQKEEESVEEKKEEAPAETPDTPEEEKKEGKKEAA